MNSGQEKYKLIGGLLNLVAENFKLGYEFEDQLQVFFLLKKDNQMQIEKDKVTDRESDDSRTEDFKNIKNQENLENLNEFKGIEGMIIEEMDG